jgi:predicted HAD superfamily Cof-like phosphohydrolase
MTLESAGNDCADRMLKEIDKKTHKQIDLTIYINITINFCYEAFLFVEEAGSDIVDVFCSKHLEAMSKKAPDLIYKANFADCN